MLRSFLLPAMRATKGLPFLQRLGAAILSVSLFAALVPSTQGVEPRGLPYVRTYTLDEIGNVPRGLRIGFDHFGRVAVMYDGIYSVLNDSTWVNRIAPDADAKVKITSVAISGGKYYFGARGSWGAVETTPDGKFRTVPFSPADLPAWTGVTPFNKILCTATGVYFYEFNGVVYWDFARRKNFFFELPRVSTVFQQGNRVFVACQDRLLREILPDSGTIRVACETRLEGRDIRLSAPLDASHTLLGLQDGQLMIFDGLNAEPWPVQEKFQLRGRIAALEPLVGGGVAIAITGKGLLIVSADGRIEWVLTQPDLQRINTMAAGEPGVLWVSGGNAVQKIFYDSPLTEFGQQLGIAPYWPRIASWNDQILTCSNSALYRLIPSAPGYPSQFEEIVGPSKEGTQCIASSGGLLLLGNTAGVFSGKTEGGFVPVLSIANVWGMEFVSQDTCLVIGSNEIAALRYTDGHWSECAPRIKGVGDSPILTHKAGSVWFETGVDGVGRLSLRNGKLSLERIMPPWSGAVWTNIGSVGSTIILSSPNGKRAYYDEEASAFCQRPQLDELLNRSPFWITRVKEDNAGNLWASHAQGVVMYRKEGSGYVADSSTYELRNDSYPSVTLLPDNSLWVTTSRSLYHVENSQARALKQPHAMLVSLTADRTNLEMIDRISDARRLPKFSYNDNSLSFRLFSGTYAWRSAPLYEYRLSPSDPWTRVEPNLLLQFPKLQDGFYRLEVRQAGPVAAKAPALTLNFEIKPPWFRTPAAYGSSLMLLLLLIGGVAYWSTLRSRRRNTVLERLVSERTRQLEDTMHRLEEETRNTAILAERSRLAGEIHDSLQQGLSGSILQLDTTLNHPDVTGEIGARLGVMRSMLSYTREEIQHAVWNLASPLLRDSSLGEALRTLAGYVNAGKAEIRVEVKSQPARLKPSIQHNLLRIAQEAIGNAVKHANAKHIEVTLEQLPGSLVLGVRDDGVGFDPDARLRLDGHFGLRGLRSRAKAIKADLIIHSSPGEGTTIRVSVPDNILSTDDSNNEE